MTSVEWEEVKRLAADFQRAQLSSTAQRLSERNCVEIISKLLELKRLDVVFTIDGKEYVTPQHLIKEIRDELFLHGGRVNLVELSQILNVDLSHVEVRAAEFARLEPKCSLVLGQLIDETYVNRIAQEINERLEQDGQVSVSDLTRVYDLPSEFLQQVVEKQLGKIINGQQDKNDPRVIFTDAFVARNKACIQGALSAVTKPTPVSIFLTQCGIQERLFFSITDSLLGTKTIVGGVTGKQGGNSIFVPSIYTKSQSDWVRSFYRQNGYLEYDALSRLGISDPRGFVAKHFPNEKLVLLSSGAVGNALIEQIEATVDEALSGGTWVDIMPSLPSVFTGDDAEDILKEVLRRKKNNVQHRFQIFCNTIIMTDTLIQNVVKRLEPVMQKKAEQAVASGSFLQSQVESKATTNIVVEDAKPDKREERRKKVTAGKTGGGTQGRETKTKSTKKKVRGKVMEVDDDDDDVSSNSKNAKPSGLKLEYITISELEEFLNEDPSLQDSFDELVTEIATHIHISLNKSCHDTAQKIFEATMASSAQSRRKTHGELQDKINAMMSNVRCFEKGIKQFQDKDNQQLLTKHLLKTLCTDITNEIFMYAVQENTNQYEQCKAVTSEIRMKMLNDVPKEAKDPLLKLHKSLSGSTIDDFLNAVEVAIGPGICDMFIKKTDKKKEKQLHLSHRQALLEQCSTAQDPALVLHLATLIIFQTVSQTMLHASGRFVPNILGFLKSHLPEDVYKTLVEYQDMVMKLLFTAEKDEGSLEVSEKLKEQMSVIKDIACTFKKSTEKVQRTE